MSRIPAGRVPCLLLFLGAPMVSPAESPSGRVAPGSPLELIDIEGLPRLRSCRTYQASGYDRGDGFYDSGNFLREDTDGSWVLLDVRGPGCVDRIWTTVKRRLELDWIIEVDGKAWLQTDRDALFPDGPGAALAHEDFRPPLSGRSTPLACYSYVPVPFQDSCRVRIRPRAPLEERDLRTNSAGKRIPHVYYQIGYRIFPEGTRVARLDDPERGKELRSAADLWQGYAFPLAQGDLSHGSIRVEPGEDSELLRVEGPGVVNRIDLRIAGLGLDERSRLRLRIHRDGEDAGAVDAPLDGYFAVGQSAGPVRGLLAGGDGDAFYSCLPVPFRRSLSLRVENRSTQGRDVSWGLARTRFEELPDNLAFLHAREYRYENAPPGEDLVLLEASGRGHLVGCTMVDVGNMEGDERISIDGGPISEFHGTGTEDFLNFAWGLSHRGSFALHGLNAHATSTGGHANGYRFFLADAVPFTRSIRFTIEHGHGNEDPGRYRGVVFWYQADEP